MELPEPEDRLNSWKEIAAFLGRTVRTVQRWEKSHGLPLRRGGPGQRGAVVGSKRDIGEWWQRRGSGLDVDQVTPGISAPADATLDGGRKTSGLWRAVLAAVAVLLILIAGSGVPTPRSSRPAPVPGMGRLFAASTSEGRRPSFIPLGESPAGLALSPSGHLAYVTLHERAEVAVIDLRARRLVDRFDVIEYPGKLILTGDGTRVVVSGLSEVGVFDLRRRVLSRFRTGVGWISDMHLSGDGRSVWLALAQNGLKVLDLESGRLDAIPTVGCPMRFAAAPGSRRLYLSYQCVGPGGRWGHDAIEILDEVTRTSILARSGPPLVGSGIAVAPEGNHLWADAADACRATEYDRAGCPAGSGPVLHALRAETLEPIMTTRVPGDGTTALPIFFPDGSRLLIVGPGFQVVDRRLGTVHEQLDIRPGFGVFTPDGGRFIALDHGTTPRLLEFEIAPPADPVTLSGVATHWTGDGTANDVVGGTHALSAEGVRFEAGRYGLAFSFDEASGGVSFGRRLDADVTTGRYTSYTAWLKPRRVEAMSHIATRTGPAGWSWSITEEGRMAFCFADAPAPWGCPGAGLIGRTVLQPERWTHVAIVRDPSTLRLFVNGREDGSMSLEGFDRSHVPEYRAQLRLGAGPEGMASYRGLIDEVVLFRRALSGPELVNVMRETSFDAR